MAEDIVSAKYSIEDDVSAKAGAMAGALSAVADAADTVETKVKRSDATFRAIATRYDDVGRAASALAKAQRDLATLQDRTGNAATAAGVSQDALGRAIDAATAKVLRLKSAMAETVAANAGMPAGEAALARVLLERAAATDTATEAQKRFNTVLGVQATSGTDYASRAADVAAFGAAIDSLRAKYVPLESAMQALRNGLAEVDAGFNTNILSIDEALAANEKLQASYRLTAFAVNQAAQAEAAAVAASNNALVGVKAPSNPDDYASRAADVAAYGASLDSLRAKFDPVFAASKKYEAALNEVSEAERVGAINSRLAATARQQATDAFAAAGAPVDAVTKSAKAQKDSLDSLTGSTGQQTFALRQLGVQSVQTLSSIATGQPILTTFIQQGHQVVDVALATGTGFGLLGQGVKIVAGILLSTVGIVASVAVGLGAMAYAAESGDARMRALQNTLRSTRADYVSLGTEIEKAARQAAGTGTGIGTGDARSAATTIAAVPNFAGSTADLKAYLLLAADAAAAMGETVPQAAEKFASALRDPATAARQAEDNGIRGFNAALVDSIKLLQDGGDKAGAFAKYTATLSGAVSGARDNVTPFRQALRDLGNAFTGPTSSIGSVFKDIGAAIDAAGTLAINTVAALVNTVNWAGRTLASLTPGGAAVAAPMSGVPANIQGAITAGAARAGLDPNLVASIQNLEGVRNPDGTWQTSSAGAQGPMQVQPGTFSDMATKYGITGGISNDAANIAAGALYLRELIDRFHSTDAGVAAYNMGPNKYAKAIASGTSLPNETQAYVQNFRSQYAGTGILAAPGGRLAATAPGVGTGAADTLGNDAFNAYKGSGALSVQIAQNAADQSLLQKGIDQAAGAGDTDTVNKLSEALAIAKGRATDMITEQAKLARSAKDAVAPLQAQDGATRDLAEIQQKFVEAARSSGKAVDQTALLSAQTSKLEELAAAHRDAVAAIDRDTAGQEAIATAYTGGAKSAIDAQNRTKALDDARKTAIPGTAAYVAQVITETDALNRNAAAKADVGTAQKLLAQNDDLETLQKEISLVGASTEVRNKELAALKERQRIIAAGGDVDSVISRQSIANTNAISDSTAALARQTNAVNEMANAGSTAFDSIGTSISNAFTTGAGKAVNFGNIAKAALGSVIQYALKIAVLNPVLNSLFGGSRVTITDTIAALGQIGGGTSGIAGGGGTVVAGGNSSDTFGNYGAFGGIGSVGSIVGGGTAVGASSGGFGSILSSAGSLGSLSNLSGIGNWLGISGSGGLLSTPLWGGVSAGEQAFLGSAGVANAGSVGATTAGSLLGGVGLGFGAGMLTNTLLGGHQLGGTIGSGAGALAGAAIGSIIPGIGTIIGGLIGGIVGGAGGGLFGPGPKHHGYRWDVGAQADGTLGTIGRTYVDSVAQDQYNSDMQAIAQINQYLSANSLSASGQFSVGGNNGVDSQVGSVGAGFDQLRFNSNSGASSSTLNKIFKGRSFADTNALQAAVSFAPTYDSLSKVPAGSVADSIDQINTAFADAAGKAALYGLSLDGLMTAQVAQTKAVRDAAAATVLATQQGLQVRLMAAQGNAAGSTTLAFDASAQQQRDQLSTQLAGLFGDAYKASADYASNMKLLNDTLAAERAKVLDSVNDPARQSIAGVFSSLASYVRSIETGSASPLSPQDQYALSRSGFQSIAAKASGGDYSALQQVQGYANDFLGQSRNLNGSGAQYATDFQSVVDVLTGISNTSPDTLTSSAMAEIQQTATDQMVAAMADLKAQLEAIRLELQQAAATP